MAFKKINFAELDRPGSPEALARRQQQEQSLGAKRDEERFQGRSLRDVTVTTNGEMRMTSFMGDTLLCVSNERGNFMVSLDHDRADTDEMRALRDGMNRALFKQEDRGIAQPMLAVEATGVFKSRNFKDRHGEWHKSWDFLATKLSLDGLDEEGKVKRFTAGFDVRQQPPKEKETKKESRGSER